MNNFLPDPTSDDDYKEEMESWPRIIKKWTCRACNLLSTNMTPHLLLKCSCCGTKRRFDEETREALEKLRIDEGTLVKYDMKSFQGSLLKNDDEWVNIHDNKKDVFALTDSIGLEEKIEKEDEWVLINKKKMILGLMDAFDDDDDDKKGFLKEVEIIINRITLNNPSITPTALMKALKLDHECVNLDDNKKEQDKFNKKEQDKQ